jgi:hypothetical protein
MIVYISPYRRRARHMEREYQAALEARDAGALTGTQFRLLAASDVPDTMHGARYERAGFLQHAVVLTEGRGH